MSGRQCREGGEDLVVERDRRAPQDDGAEFSDFAQFAETVGDDRLGDGGEDRVIGRAPGCEAQIGDADFAEAMNLDFPDADAEGFHQQGECTVHNAGAIEVGDRGNNGDEEEDSRDDDGRESDETHEPPEDSARRPTDLFRAFDWSFLCHGQQI